MEHAYLVLTNGNLPYWRVKPAGNESGGATELGKLLQSHAPIIDPQQKLFGLFDRDAKSLQEFKGLKGFVSQENHTIRKHPEHEIYAISLPAISSRLNYIQVKQEFNFLEIEHYFSDELLEKHNKIKDTPIPEVKEIIGNKTSFVKEIVKIQDPVIFENFIEIFERIDKICGFEVEYFRTSLTAEHKPI